MLVIYLQIPAEQRKTVLQRAAAAVSAGGRLLVVGHHTDWAEFPNLIPRTAQRVERVIDGQWRPALDVVVEAQRCPAAQG